MKKIFAAIFILTSTLFGISQGSIEEIMRGDLNKALEIMADENIAKKDKPEHLFRIFDKFFDYKLMSKLSLSKRYQTLSAQQQELFDSSYERQLKVSFANKLDSYTNQTIKVEGIQKINDKRIYLQTNVMSEGKAYPIVFKFYPASGDDWRVYDMDVLGVSVVQTYRSQFSDVMENGDFDELIVRLKQTKLPDNKE